MEDIEIPCAKDVISMDYGDNLLSICIHRVSSTLYCVSTVTGPFKTRGSTIISYYILCLLRINIMFLTLFTEDSNKGRCMLCAGGVDNLYALL